MNRLPCEVDIYPVGLLADLRDLVHGVEPLPLRLRRFRRRLRSPIGRIRARKWHAAKTYLNGYLAEPLDWTQLPDGLTRCGSGWTRGRAYRDLIRRADAARREDADRG